MMRKPIAGLVALIALATASIISDASQTRPAPRGPDPQTAVITGRVVDARSKTDRRRGGRVDLNGARSSARPAAAGQRHDAGGRPVHVSETSRGRAQVEAAKAGFIQGA
jgi:hypothetical protein